LSVLARSGCGDVAASAKASCAQDADGDRLALEIGLGARGIVWLEESRACGQA